MIHICNWQKKIILLPILVWFLILKRGQDAFLAPTSWTLTYEDEDALIVMEDDISLHPPL